MTAEIPGDAVPDVPAAPGTTAAFHAAYRAYGRGAAEAIASGQNPDLASLAESSGLTAAARAHIAASRPLETLLAEYAADNAAAHAAAQAHTPPDPGSVQALQELANELTGVRMAAAILAGSLPGTGAIASAGAEF
jgi:hypothetical protein